MHGWKRRLRRILIVTAMLAVLAGGATWAFCHVGQWLVVEDQLERAQAIVVLSGGMPAERAKQDGHADLVISDGVLHHTGDASRSFAENSRVLRTGGQMYLAVYKPTGRYALLHRYPGSLIRCAVRSSIGKFAVHIFLLPSYYLLHLLKSGGKRTWSGARNLFSDYFVSPRVDFVSRETIERWSRHRGMRIVSFSSSSKENVHSFLLQKAR